MTANMGVYRCGLCGEVGHTAKRCSLVTRKIARSGHSAANDSYQANRAAGLCDDCGRSSRRFARCTACRARRKRWPSRQRAYRYAKEKG